MPLYFTSLKIDFLKNRVYLSTLINFLYKYYGTKAD